MSYKIRFSTDRKEIDLDFVASFLAQESYWARGRSIEVVASTISNSFCLGMFYNSAQIGFARVVTDYETFAYIMDVFISNGMRNRGYGRQLVEKLLRCPELKRVPKFHLKTQDAKEFYTRVGFSEIGGGFMVLEINQ